MVAHRKPTKILELSGAFAKNPKRARARELEPEPNEPVGECPSHLSAKHKAIWDEVVGNCVDGVVTIQDRHALEILVMGIHDVRFGVMNAQGERVDMRMPERDKVFKQLAAFGLTPADRSRVQIAKKDNKPKGFNGL